MKSWTIKISLVALVTHVLLIFMGPYIVMNQLDRNIADAIDCLLYTSDAADD
mgnify:CR=1 FL=1